ncbi:acylneuraminate cytidylyltransferase family protein [Lelliottia amnigena]|uniref:Acylneuraminate cytidylyltransferase family protein n=1 Tax=Lelliottia amnigena TaxID=61646 RepID=A0AAP2AHU8_LELAM|nr:acylneuraminate cytidylyltransferase family protein [Lelliottia amnigena]MBL5900978.1 acylneuraminate cytidylyltransferase family protein [Lelliottia amnigena]MBL5936562.1 acylneuraminate cytidylyltransferase family protein [Lelliottia amnigena]NTX71370.1 acylneuraminate cytidylyltransferase family protein [Lelliottia amnigena]
MSIKIALIPARGGSKRIPNKNLKIFNGKPLIVWTIEAAIEYGGFDSVIVSTDSEEIANVAVKEGAYVPFLRPAELSNDTATTNDVIQHAVNWLEERGNKVEVISLLQPTSPLRDASDIHNAMSMLDMKNADAIISVCETEHPIQHCNQLGEDLCMNNFLAEEALKRTQDLMPYYRLNGAIYIFRREFVGSLLSIYNSRSYAYIMNKYKSIDIDDEYDFLIAEFLKKQIK